MLELLSFSQMQYTKNEKETALIFHAISVSPIDMLSLPVSYSMDWEM
jgi:hypothetical protein